MLGIISAAGNALRAFGTVHPAIKWGVVILAGLLAVELIGKEAISVYVAMRTAQDQIQKADGEAAAAAAQEHIAKGIGVKVDPSRISPPMGNPPQK